MIVENPYLPCDKQNIDDIPLEEESFSYYGSIKKRKKLPCREHSISYPSIDIPEVKHRTYYLCPICNWFVDTGGKDEVNK